MTMDIHDINLEMADAVCRFLSAKENRNHFARLVRKEEATLKSLRVLREKEEARRSGAGEVAAKRDDGNIPRFDIGGNGGVR